MEIGLSVSKGGEALGQTTETGPREVMRIGMRCPKCGAYLEEAKDKVGYWECPYKCGEWWPDEDKTQEDFAKAARRALNEDIRIGGAIKKGGGSKTKRHKKKPFKAVMTERYKLE